MPRYIDADKLIAHLKDELKGCHLPFGSRSGGKGIAYGTILGLKSAISFAKTLPAADVVPKSEVEATVEKLMSATDKVICEAKAEVASEIFEEIDNILYKFAYPSLTAIGKINVINAEGYHLHTRDYAELKKKYTEGKE